MTVQPIDTKTATPVPHVSDGWIGRPAPRVEDDRLLRGASRYVSDIAAGLDVLHVAFVRSPHPHAEVRSIDAAAAAALPGTVLILTAEDLTHLGDLPADWVPSGMVHEAHHPLLARDRVRYVGEAVAAVVATDRYAARDAVEAVAVDYAPLPHVVDQEAALAPDAPRLHEAPAGNLALRKVRTGGDYERAKARADVVLTRRLTNNRVTAAPMEGRAVLSRYDPVTGHLEHHTSTQLPHVHARSLAACLGLPMHRLRLVSPDVGGGFGAKLAFYAEDVVVAEAASRTGRSCYWAQDRVENLTSNTHGRDHVQHVEIAATRDGIITGLHARIVADLGAYALGMGPGVPAINAGLTLTGPYRIRNVISDVTLAYTNRAPTGPYRGAGHPEATFLIERMMDELAVKLGIDPAEIRRRNFVPAGAMPYKLPLGFVLDGGDYAANLDTALSAADYDGLRAMRAEARAEGRHIGIGLATYAESSGAGPSMGMSAVGFRRAGHESARVVMHSDGRVMVFSGAHSHGQGHATSLAQIAAQTLGIAITDVAVVQGDTATVPFGTGTYNSRTIAVGGSAVLRAAEAIRARLMAIAAIKLRARPRDLVLRDGVFRVGRRGPAQAAARRFRQVEERIKDVVLHHVSGLGAMQVTRGAETMTVGEAASEAHLGHDLPLGTAPGLDETIFFDPKDMPSSYATHVSVVEVSPSLGHIALLRHVVVDDCGTVINPMLAAGQVHGGAAQGIGQALMESAAYGADGRPTAASLMGYAVPRATDLPSFETSHTVTPTKLNPLGAKGVGEGAAIGAPPALVNAVLDALRPLGVTDIGMPMTPEAVWRAVETTRPW